MRGGISHPVFFAGMGLSFAVGFGVAWQLQPDSAAQQDASSQSARTTSAHGGGSMNQFAAVWSGGSADPHTSPKATIDELWAKGKEAQDKHQQAAEIQEQLRDAALNDPAAQRDLIRRFEAERDPQARAMLQTVLASVNSPEVLALSTRLAASQDAAEREEGFAMLMRLSPDSPEVRKLVRQALATEQSPAVLSQAVAALTPGVVANSEAAGVVAQLDQLAQHADPAVRSQSLLQLAQWDKSGQVEGRLSQALNDQSPEVRNAAVAAIGESGIRSDSMKAALLGILANSAERSEVKDGALYALTRFSLSPDEYALYSRERAEADKRFKQ